MKSCSKCFLPNRRFYKNKINKDGLQSQCTDCHRMYTSAACKRFLERNPEYYVEKQRVRRKTKPREYIEYRKRTPQWLTKGHKQLINMFYERASYLTRVTGIVWSVDHIIPLQGKNISGLHVPWNLRIIPKSENSQKNNKW